MRPRYGWNPSAAQAAVHALRGNRGGSRSDLHTSLDDTEPSEILRRRRIWFDENIARFVAGIDMDSPETIAIYPQLPGVALSNHYAFSAEEEGCLFLSALRRSFPLGSMYLPDHSFMPSGHLTVTITESRMDPAVLRVNTVLMRAGWSLGRVLAIGLPRRTPYLIVYGADGHGPITCHPETVVHGNSAVLVHCHRPNCSRLFTIRECHRRAILPRAPPPTIHDRARSLSRSPRGR